tara:strand:- start:2393 stop:2611 length:219 start_codon:yes stop_codon:yes gene_type:complete
VIEVYPVATFMAHGVTSSGYKKPEYLTARRDIPRALGGWVEPPLDWSAMLESDDALDAAVCVLAGFDFLKIR